METASATEDDPAWLERACLGGDLPAAAGACLKMAAQSHADPERAEIFLHRALIQAPQHPAVYIAMYRFHFYGGRIREALPYASLCLTLAARELGLESDWREVAAGDAGFDDMGAFAPRFFLFSLKAYGYLQMRLGNLEEGQRAIAKVLQLDPGDRVGASVLQGVLDRLGRTEEDD